MRYQRAAKTGRGRREGDAGWRARAGLRRPVAKVDRMSVFALRPVAISIARLLQIGVRLGSARATERARARFPECPRRAEGLRIPTSFGATSLTVYRPEPGGGLPAVHLNLHGGGYVLGLTELDDPTCRLLAAGSGSVVVNADYVVAPQHPFPQPTNHAYEIASWLAANGAEHGWDGGRLTIGGQSAGGALATAVARLALERGGPVVSLQVLHYPPLDLTVPARSKRSVIRRPTLRPWMGDVFDSSYVPDPAQRADRLVSPAGAGDSAELAGIAPAVVIAAEHDILADEAGRYAGRLARAGALVEHRTIAGADHGYDLDDDDRAKETYTIIAEHIRRAVSVPERGVADDPGAPPASAPEPA